MARAFRWEGEAAVAHLDDLELDALADGARAVITLLGGDGPEGDGSPGKLRTPGGEVPLPSPGDATPGADDTDARFAELTAGLDLGGPGDPTGEDPRGAALEAGAVSEGFLQDSAVSRLLPPAHTKDADLAHDFATFAHGGIREAKLTNLRALVAACERSRESGVLALDPAEARQVLAAFTDVRLVLADRLDIHEDGDAERVDQQTDALVHALERGERITDAEEIALQLGLHHGFVGWLQETLVEALLRH